METCRYHCFLKHLKTFGSRLQLQKKFSPLITLFRNPALPLKQSDPDLLRGIHWGSAGGEKQCLPVVGIEKARLWEGLQELVRGWGLAWRGVGKVELGYPDENYLQVLNIQQRVCGWQDASSDPVIEGPLSESNILRTSPSDFTTCMLLQSLGSLRQANS